MPNQRKRDQTRQGQLKTILWQRTWPYWILAFGLHTCKKIEKGCPSHVFLIERVFKTLLNLVLPTCKAELKAVKAGLPAFEREY